MQLFDPDAELRRAEKYSDISRIGFVASVTVLMLVAAFVCYMFYLERAGG